MLLTIQLQGFDLYLSRLVASPLLANYLREFALVSRFLAKIVGLCILITLFLGNELIL